MKLKCPVSYKGGRWFVHLSVYLSIFLYAIFISVKISHLWWLLWWWRKCCWECFFRGADCRSVPKMNVQYSCTALHLNWEGPHWLGELKPHFHRDAVRSGLNRDRQPPRGWHRPLGLSGSSETQGYTCAPLGCCTASNIMWNANEFTRLPADVKHVLKRLYMFLCKEKQTTLDMFVFFPFPRLSPCLRGKSPSLKPPAEGPQSGCFPLKPVSTKLRGATGFDTGPAKCWAACSATSAKTRQA